MKTYNTLIIGSGIAGLYAALQIPSTTSCAILCKETPDVCNTWYAQGGITTVRGDEDKASHTQDTYEAGAKAGDLDAIHVLSTFAQEVIRDLIDRGMLFDTDPSGALLYTKEAAHSTPRILHSGGDATGARLHAFLASQNPHPILEQHVVVDLLIQDNHCYGVTVARRCQESGGCILENIYASHVIIASGGLGGLYAYNTNARTVSGELQGICALHNIPLADMEMMQFHPTVFVDNTFARKVLLTEALRGEGATIEDETGRRFLFDSDPRGELASRDIVSRAIFAHRAAGHQVYLSFKAFDEKTFCHRFPTVCQTMAESGYQLPNQKVPISPAFHYAMGGIATDTWGRVQGVEGLFAIGEAACTGVHGANRLASNSLLEGLVFAKRATSVCQREPLHSVTFPIPDFAMGLPGDKEIKNELRTLMWECAGIVRTTEGLTKALTTIDTWLDSDIGRLIRLRLMTARAIIVAALARTESLGAHYRLN